MTCIVPSYRERRPRAFPRRRRRRLCARRAGPEGEARPAGRDRARAPDARRGAPARLRPLHAPRHQEARLLHPLPLRRPGARPTARGASYEALEPLFRGRGARLRRAARRRWTPMPRRSHAIGGEPPPEPRWNQDWFPRLDAAAAYVLVRETRPAPHRRGRLRPFHALHAPRRPRRRPRHRDHRRSTPRRAPTSNGLGATHPAQTVQEAGTAPFAALAARRHAVHRFQPHPDAGHRRGFPLQPRPAGAARRRARAHPRHLPARRLSGRNGNGAATTSSSASPRSSRAAATACSGRATMRRPAWRRPSRPASPGALELQAGAHEASLWLVKERG